MFKKIKAGKVFTFNNVLIAMAIIIGILSIAIIALSCSKENVNTNAKGITDLTINYASTEESFTWDVSAQYDETVIATLSEDGTLTISGIGRMLDYPSEEYCPWYDVKDQIKHVKIERGITNIGNYAFKNCYYLQSVEMGSTVHYIGEESFYGCKNLKNVQMPESIISIDTYAFAFCTRLYEFEIPSSVQLIGEYILQGAEITTFIDKDIKTVEVPNIVRRVLEQNDILAGQENAGVHWYYEEKHEIDYITIENTTLTFTEDCQYVRIQTYQNNATGEFWYNISYNEWDVSNSFDGSVIAKLSENGTLTISGNGSLVYTPWYNFKNHIKSVKIEEGITYIQMYAFVECNSLETVEIANTVTYIAEGAFKECSSLKNVSIPSSLTYIGEYAFVKCNQLQAINVDDNNEMYEDIDGVLFSKSDKRLMVYPGGKEDIQYQIPEGVTTICDYAFATNTHIESVTIPNSTTTMGREVFIYCTNLKNIEISNGLKNIGDRAFEECINLKNIEIPNTVTSIGYNAFYKCTNLENIEIPNSVTSIGNWAFGECSTLKAIEIPASVTNFETNFYMNSKLENVKILCPITEISGTAFNGCENLKTIELPATLTTIGGGAFSECINLESINIPDNVVTIGDYAFSSCSKLKSINIPDTVTSIGIGAFYECTSLESINIPNGLTKIEASIFADCKNLTSIEIPTSVTSVEERAFEGCRKLTEITIPNGVSNIGIRAFSECKSFTKIEIPESVLTIGEGAFEQCNQLKDINILNSEAIIGENAFDISVGEIVDTTDIELPDILKKAQDTNNILYSSEGFSTNYCTIEDSKVTLDEYYGYNYATITVLSGPLKDYSYSICFSEGPNWNLKLYPDGILEITGEGEIYFPYFNYEGIKKIKIGEGITNVDLEWFYYFHDLTSIEIPSTVTEIVVNNFYSYPEEPNNLIEIKVNENNEKYKDIDGVLFTRDTNELITYPVAKTEKQYIVPQGVTSIGEYAFMGCQYLESIQLSQSVKNIGDGAFKCCENLEIINISASVETIGNRVFYDCANLKQINVDDNNPNYKDDDGILYTKDNTTLIACPKGRTNKKVEVLDGVLTIKQGAFEYCYLDMIKLPNSVTTIETNAFSGGTKVINIPKGITTLEANSFGNNTLYNYIPSNITNIKADALPIWVDNLYIEIPATVTNIEYDAFRGMSDYITIICTKGSAAEEYAKTYNVKYIILETIKSKDPSIEIKEDLPTITWKPDDTKPNTIKPSDLLDRIEGDGDEEPDCNIVTPNGEVVDPAGDTNIGTGYEIRFGNGKIYIIIIIGDINGDGKMRLSDLSRIKSLLVNAIEVDSIYEQAADINGDGKLKLSDLSRLKNLLVGN